MAVRALVATAVTAGLLTAPHAAEAARRKPMSGSYTVNIPVPYPLEADSGSHCEDAPDGLSRDMRTLTLPSSGKLTVTLSDTVGDLVIELFDPRGRLVGTAGSAPGVGVVNTLVFKKKSRASQKYTVGVCNFSGGPNGHVKWTFAFS